MIFESHYRVCRSCRNTITDPLVARPSGGAGGIKHFMDHLMDPLTAMIKTLGMPDVTPELKQTIVEGVLREAGNRSVDELAQQENELIIGLLRSRAQSENRAPKTKQAAA